MPERICAVAVGRGGFATIQQHETISTQFQQSKATSRDTYHLVADKYEYSRMGIRKADVTC